MEETRQAQLQATPKHVSDLHLVGSMGALAFVIEKEAVAARMLLRHPA